MKLPSRNIGSSVRFNITPLIDIVFLLVIFFLVASHFAKSEPTEVVELPNATQTADDTEVRRLVITILKNGTYFVSGQQVDIDMIEQMIADGAAVNASEYAVRIRSDRATPQQFIEPIILACPKYGVTQLGFRVVGGE